MISLWRLILFVALQYCRSQEFSYLSYMYESVEAVSDLVSCAAGYCTSCPFRNEISQAVKRILPQYIRGQDKGIEIISNAVAAWEFGKKMGKSDPLVIAVTGSTGIGKSETAYRLAESVFLKSTRVGQTRRFIPDGLLVLRGEDYSEISEVGSLGVGEVHGRLRSRIGQHLQKCSEKAVIVFDEVQKVMPGALEVLLPALEEAGSIAFTDSVSKKTVTLSTSQVVFVFVSDIGADKLIKLLLKYGSREAIPINVLRSEVKQALDEQWVRLQFGKTISEVVPFMPMEQTHIQDVLKLKFSLMAVENKYVYWLDIAVDSAVIEHLSSPHYLKYVNHTAKVKSSNGGQDLVTSKVFSKYGARALETGGPLQDLRALFYRHMTPWRPSQVLHIGLVNSKDTAVVSNKILAGFATAATGIDGSSSVSKQEVSAELQFYLQWCKFHESMKVAGGSAEIGGALAVDPSLAFSDSCETIWVGNLL